MARSLLLSCEAVEQGLRDPVALRGSVVRILRRRPGGPRRPQRLRQVDPPQDPRRPRDARPRHPLAARRRPRGLRPAGPGLPAGRHGRGRARRRRWPAVDEDDRPGASPSALGRAGFADGRAAVDTLSGGWRKRLAIARELAAAARRPADGRADQPPRRRRHPLAGGRCWPSGARAFLVVSHDRYFLEHVATRMLELEPRATRTASSRRDGTLQRVPRAPRRVPARAGGLPGVARQHGAARDRVAAARRQGAHDQGQGAHPGGGPADRRAGGDAGAQRGRRRTAGIDFTASRPADPASCSSPAALDQVARRPAARRAASTSILTPGHAPRPARAERQRQDHAARRARRRARRPTRARSSAPTACASCASSRSAAASIRR